jgi:hypothetical protein
MDPKFDIQVLRGVRETLADELISLKGRSYLCCGDYGTDEARISLLEAQIKSFDEQIGLIERLRENYINLYKNACRAA